VVDPLAGSYFVEWLTSEIEDRILKEIKTIDEIGGIVKAIEQGYIAQHLTNDAYEWEKSFQRKEILRVGVNIFTSEGEEMPDRVYRTDPIVEEQRLKAIKEMKKNRDNYAVNKALEDVKRRASEEATLENNMMAPIVEAVKVYATYGEICGALKEVWGEYTARNVV
jgi:methylmalonyl-CoA mutase N-terminal domain/subunit